MNDEHLKRKSLKEKADEAKRIKDELDEEFEGDESDYDRDLGECNS